MLLAFYVGGEFGPDELREMALAGSFILIFLFNKFFLYIRFIVITYVGNYFFNSFQFDASDSLKKL